jgi:SAM-dependent methyltransferase
MALNGTSNPVTAADADVALAGAVRQVLHVGCGPLKAEKLHQTFRRPGWREVRLDIDPAVTPDIVASMTDMSHVPTGAYDAIWSSHNVEHLYDHEVGIALAEFGRVLKPGGFALITLPDLQAVARLVADDKLTEAAYSSPAGAITPLDIIYGHRASVARGNHFMAHRTGFTAKSLAIALQKGGFVHGGVSHGTSFDLWALAYTAKPPAGALQVKQAAVSWSDGVMRRHAAPATTPPAKQN